MYSRVFKVGEFKYANKNFKGAKRVAIATKFTHTKTTRNSSGDEIANVNFLCDDIVHALKIQ